MKTRRIHTKIWNDPWFEGLDRLSKLLFLYFVTCKYMGFTGYAEITDQRICFETNLTENQLEKSKKRLEPKVLFIQNWVYVVNLQKYDPIKGDENPLWKAYNKELDSIPQEIIRGFNGVLGGHGEGHGGGMEGSQGKGKGKGNGNSSNINNTKKDITMNSNTQNADTASKEANAKQKEANAKQLQSKMKQRKGKERKGNKGNVSSTTVAKADTNNEKKEYGNKQINHVISSFKQFFHKDPVGTRKEIRFAARNMCQTINAKYREIKDTDNGVAPMKNFQVAVDSCFREVAMDEFLADNIKTIRSAYNHSKEIIKNFTKKED